MPNHIQNRLTFEGDPVEIQNLMNFMKTSDDQPFDFNQLIPMPKDLDVQSGSCVTDSAMAYLRVVNPANIKTVHPNYAKMNKKDFDDLMARISVVPDIRFAPNKIPAINDDSIPVDPANADSNALLAAGEIYVSNFTKYGAMTWYEWCISNWDTKWNAYWGQATDNTIEFNTAWGPPTPVIDALAAKYPDLKITHVWACEFCGDSGGKVVYQNNKATVLLNGSISEKDAYDAYFEAYDTTPEDEGLVYNPFTGMYCAVNPCAGYEDTSGMPALASMNRTITSAYVKGKGDDAIFISMVMPNARNFTPKTDKERNASLWILNWTK